MVFLFKNKIKINKKKKNIYIKFNKNIFIKNRNYF